MKTDWEKTGDRLTIRQGYSAVWVYILIGIIGVPCLLIGALGLLSYCAGYLSTNPLSPAIVSGSFLIFHLVFAIGLSSLWVALSPRSMMKCREQFVFDNGREKMAWHSTAIGEEPLEVPYADISRLLTIKEPGGPDDPDVYHLMLIKKDEARFWITGFGNPEKLGELTALLAEHTGFAVHDASKLDTAREAAKQYERRSPGKEEGRSTCVRIDAGERGTSYAIRYGKLRFFPTFAAMVVYLLFLEVPLYIVNTFLVGKEAASFPVAARIMPVLFITIWISVLAFLLFIGLKDYVLTVNGDGIEIELRSRGIPLFRAKLTVPREAIVHVRTNRLPPYGGASLALGVRAGYSPAKSGMVTLMNLNAIARINPRKAVHDDTREITLWELHPGARPGDGPNIFDLLLIERGIQNELRLIEK